MALVCTSKFNIVYTGWISWWTQCGYLSFGWLCFNWCFVIGQLFNRSISKVSWCAYNLSHPPHPDLPTAAEKLPKIESDVFWPNSTILHGQSCDQDICINPLARQHSSWDTNRIVLYAYNRNRIVDIDSIQILLRAWLHNYVGGHWQHMWLILSSTERENCKWRRRVKLEAGE